MAQPIISIENISKRYNIGQHQSYGSLRDSIMDTLTFRVNKQHGQQFWALKDINFDVAKGETVGIIGRNGAGKSTLLKVLSQITPPTTGKITLNGRLASLLEVGTGFHPELTGRENIFLNGAILGMSQKEIKRKFDEIVAFAEIEKFLDTPVKRYSSGMYVRLAFAVAAHLEPEILIVDEVLSVGDAEFQKKCLGKMSDVGKAGRTILFVSHNMAAISQLCKRVILLDQGGIKADGPTADTIDKYLSHSSVKANTMSLADPSIRRNSLNTSSLKWQTIGLTNSRSQITDHLAYQEPFAINLDFRVTAPVQDVVLGFAVQSALGYPIFNSFQTDSNIADSYKPGIYRVKIEIDPNILAPGLYEISLGANGHGVIDWIPTAHQFTISAVGLKSDIYWSSNRGGMINYPVKWQNLTKEG